MIKNMAKRATLNSIVSINEEEDGTDKHKAVKFDKWDAPGDQSWGKPQNINFYLSDDSFSLEEII